MIISMKRGAPREEIDHVCDRIRQFGYKVHSIKGEERVVIGAVGAGDLTRAIEQLEATPGVERVVPISQPFKLVSREFQQEKTTIRMNGLEIGGRDFTLMAGPCSVESEEQLLSTARAVRAAGAEDRCFPARSGDGDRERRFSDALTAESGGHPRGFVPINAAGLRNGLVTL